MTVFNYTSLVSGVCCWCLAQPPNSHQNISTPRKLLSIFLKTYFTFIFISLVPGLRTQECHKQSTSLIDELKKPFSEFWTQVSSSRFDLQFAKLRIPWLSWPIMRTFQVSSSGLDGRTFATQIPSFFCFGFNREKYRKKYRKAVQKENLRRRRQNVTEKLLLKIQNR